MSENKAISAYVSACLDLTGKVKKDGTNPHFKSGYATLESVLETILPSCKEHKIVPLQEIIKAETGIAVKTTIYHEGGDSLSLEPMPIPVDKNSAHGVVSASTYGRRVSLMAIFGLAPSDDDGNAAVEASSKRINEMVEKIKAAGDQGDWAEIALLSRTEEWIEAWGKLDSHKKGMINKITPTSQKYRDLLSEYQINDDKDGAIQTWDELTEKEKKALWPMLQKDVQEFIKLIKE